MLTLMLEFLKDRAEQAQNAIQAQKDAENAVVDQAVHGGLQNSMTVRRIQLKFGPKR
jgi:hypothetical protein